jgi:hypothetical protein
VWQTSTVTSIDWNGPLQALKQVHEGHSQLEALEIRASFTLNRRLEPEQGRLDAGTDGRAALRRLTLTCSQSDPLSNGTFLGQPIQERAE